MDSRTTAIAGSVTFFCLLLHMVSTIKKSDPSVSIKKMTFVELLKNANQASVLERSPAYTIACLAVIARAWLAFNIEGASNQFAILLVCAQVSSVPFILIDAAAMIFFPGRAMGTVITVIVVTLVFASMLYQGITMSVIPGE